MEINFSEKQLSMEVLDNDASLVYATKIIFENLKELNLTNGNKTKIDVVATNLVTTTEDISLEMETLQIIHHFCVQMIEKTNSRYCYLENIQQKIDIADAAKKELKIED